MWRVVCVAAAAASAACVVMVAWLAVLLPPSASNDVDPVHVRSTATSSTPITVIGTLDYTKHPMDKTFLIYGGGGGLGRFLVGHFRTLAKIISVDLVDNSEANVNILLGKDDSWKGHSSKILSELGNILQNRKLDAIFCVAGGWGGGSAASDDLIDVTELMWKQSVHSSVIAGQIAVKYLKENGILTLTGSQPCLHATPGMVGYGAAKAAVHQLTKSFAADGSGLPKSSKVVAILPVTLDTPMNRKSNPGADTSSWTPLGAIADKLAAWESGSQEVKSGSLVAVVTKDGKTEFSLVE